MFGYNFAVMHHCCGLLMFFARFTDLWYWRFFWWHFPLKLAPDLAWVHNNGFATDWLPKLTFCNTSCYCASNFELSEHCMMQLTKEQRIFIVIEWCRTGSMQGVANRFAKRFPGCPVPVKSTVLKNNIPKYPIEGTSRNLNIKFSTSLSSDRVQ